MKLSQTAQFRRDVKRQARQGKDQQKLIEVVKLLLTRDTLPSKHRDHPLKGFWKGRRDCHIEPDWILIYRITEDELRLERTGSHSDLF
ncbi:MAG: type II toxin-antitoxin system YafQ family toxin [Lentisphaerae bacterium]|nr:type II toxin-antitoxin system YafQ family toxin [Lentisphaerota bacterium]